MAYTTSDIGYAPAILDAEPIGWIDLAVLDNERFSIVPRHADQRIRFGSEILIADRAEKPMVIEGSGVVTLGGGWWDQVSITPLDYDGPFFDGNSQGFQYQRQHVVPYWTGTPNESPSAFDYYQIDKWVPVMDWTSPEKRRYALGIDRGTLFVNDVGVPWAGLISVTRDAPQGQPTRRYIDGRLYSVGIPKHDFVGTLSAYTYPDEFESCIGGDEMDDGGISVQGQQNKPFDLTYRTLMGDGSGHQTHYTLHFLYGCVAVSEAHTHETIDDVGAAEAFSWNIHAIPNPVPGHTPSSYFTIDSRKVNYGLLQGLEQVLYGVGSTPPRLPDIQEIRDYLKM